MKGKKGSGPFPLGRAEDKRLEAMNVAQGISRIVSSEAVFEQLLKAVDTNDALLFKRACKEAHIANDMAEYLKNIVFEGSIVAQKNKQYAAFCW